MLFMVIERFEGNDMLPAHGLVAVVESNATREAVAPFLDAP